MSHFLSPTSASGLSAPATFVRWLGNAVSVLETVRQVARERRMLAALDDRMLHDLGLNRGDVHREYGRPLWDLPSTRLD